MNKGKLTLTSLIVAAMLASGATGARDANALSLDYLNVNNTGMEIWVVNDDGMGPYNEVNMQVPIDDTKYITNGVSLGGLWKMTPEETEENIVNLNFVPLIGGFYLNENNGGFFGIGIDSYSFAADHGGKSYSDWVNNLNEMQLTVSGSGPITYGDKIDTYTVGTSNNADPVPEPTTMLLFGSGLAGLAALRRKKE